MLRAAQAFSRLLLSIGRLLLGVIYGSFNKGNWGALLAYLGVVIHPVNRLEVGNKGRLEVDEQRPPVGRRRLIHKGTDEGLIGEGGEGVRGGGGTLVHARWAFFYAAQEGVHAQRGVEEGFAKQRCEHVNVVCAQQRLEVADADVAVCPV